MSGLCGAVAKNSWGRCHRSIASLIENSQIARNISVYCDKMGGMKTKLASINARISTNDYDRIMIQEPWLNNEVFRMDRSKFSCKKKRGGGVLILVRQGITYEEIEIQEKKLVEHQVVRLSNGNQNICLVNIYGPPYGGKKQAANEINSLMLKLRKLYPCDTWILAGDFNYPDIQWSPSNGRRITRQEQRTPYTITDSSLK